MSFAFRTFAGAASLLFAGLSMPAAHAASAKEIDIKVNAALERFYSDVGGAREFMTASKAVLVFPDVIEAGFIFGGEYGEGALRIGERNVAYFNTAGASFGFQAGAQSKMILLAFMNEIALDNFRNSRGWKAGVDGTVVVLNLGVGGGIDTTNIRNPIVGFVFGNKGLMAGVSLEGIKFTRIDR